MNASVADGSSAGLNALARTLMSPRWYLDNGWMDGPTDGWMEEWKVGLVDGLIDSLID